MLRTRKMAPQSLCSSKGTRTSSVVLLGRDRAIEKVKAGKGMRGWQFLKGSQEGPERGGPCAIRLAEPHGPERSQSSLSYLKAWILEKEGRMGRTLGGGLLCSLKSLLAVTFHPHLLESQADLWRSEASECHGTSLCSALYGCALPRAPGLHPQSSQCSSECQVYPLLQGLLGTR